MGFSVMNEPFGQPSTFLLASFSVCLLPVQPQTCLKTSIPPLSGPFLLSWPQAGPAFLCLLLGAFLCGGLLWCLCHRRVTCQKAACPHTLLRVRLRREFAAVGILQALLPFHRVPCAAVEKSWAVLGTDLCMQLSLLAPGSGIHTNVPQPRSVGASNWAVAE